MSEPPCYIAGHYVGLQLHSQVVGTPLEVAAAVVEVERMPLGAAEGGNPPAEGDKPPAAVGGSPPGNPPAAAEGDKPPAAEGGKPPAAVEGNPPGAAPLEGRAPRRCQQSTGEETPFQAPLRKLCVCVCVCVSV